MTYDREVFVDIVRDIEVSVELEDPSKRSVEGVVESGRVCSKQARETNAIDQLCSVITRY